MAWLRLPHIYLLHLYHEACTRLQSSAHNAQTCLNTKVCFVWRTKRHILVTCRGNKRSQAERWECKKSRERERGLFWPNSHSSLSSSLYLHATHIVSRNTISCLKQEVKNNISHGNLGSGESCLTGMADYWCIFNKVKDLQWCMWLPFQNGRPCHLFGPAISRDVSNGEADWKSAENRTGLER